jgi:hypothetical protein
MFEELIADETRNYYLRYEMTEEDLIGSPREFPHNYVLQAKYDKRDVAGRRNKNAAMWKVWYQFFSKIRTRFIKVKKYTFEMARDDLIKIREAVAQKFPERFQEVGWYDKKMNALPCAF